MICSRYGSRSCPARTASPVTLTQAALGDAAELADPGNEFCVVRPKETLIS